MFYFRHAGADTSGDALGCVRDLKSGYRIFAETSPLIQAPPDSSVASQRERDASWRHSRLLKYPFGKM